MKVNCDNIKAELQSESCRIDLIRQHLDECQACQALYEADLKIEEALSGISDEYQSVDISVAVMQKLSLKKSRLAKLKLARVWVNVTAAIGLVLGLLVVVPWLANQVWEFSNWLIYSIEIYAPGVSSSLLGKVADSIDPSFLNTAIYLSALVLGTIIYFLWSEMKEVFQ